MPRSLIDAALIDGLSEARILLRVMLPLSSSAVATNVVPIPNTLTGSLTVSQDILNVQEFDQIGINELMEA